MAIQIRIIKRNDTSHSPEIHDQVNKFLETIKDEDFINIKYTYTYNPIDATFDEICVITYKKHIV